MSCSVQQGKSFDCGSFGSESKKDTQNGTLARGNMHNTRVSAGGIGVLFGCFGGKIDGPGLPGGFIIYQASICPKRTRVVGGRLD